MSSESAQSRVDVLSQVDGKQWHQSGDEQGEGEDVDQLLALSPREVARAAAREAALHEARSLLNAAIDGGLVLNRYVELTRELGKVPTNGELRLMRQRDPVGFVYLARARKGEFKIGRTNLVSRRLGEVGATLPVELELVHEIKTDDPVGVEAYWHRRFADRRLRREWLRLAAGDVRAFKRWRRIF